MNNQALFVSVPRFAQMVGLSERTCWYLVKEGSIPVYRVRRRTLIKVDEGCRALERLGRDEASNGC